MECCLFVGDHVTLTLVRDFTRPDEASWINKAQLGIMPDLRGSAGTWSCLTLLLYVTISVAHTHNSLHQLDICKPTAY